MELSPFALNSFLTDLLWAGEVAQRLRALAALPEDLGSVPSTHMVAPDHLQQDLMPSSGM